MIKTIIFDFDGVILDSNKIKGDTFGELFSKYGKEIKNKVIDYHYNNLGISRYNKFKFFYKNYLQEKIDNKQIEKLSEDFSEISFNKIINVNFIKGAYGFISKNYNNYSFHISSATPEKELVRICKKRKILSYFKTINGSPKTKDIHIKSILKNAKLIKNQVIFIGDSKNDFEAAKKSNIRYINVGKNKIINNYNKYHQIKNLMELSNLIKKL